MSDRVEQLFSQLRRGPWYTDPLGVPQEGFGGNGNIESQGWLSDGAVTADVIQANAVIAGKIDADAVTAREIAANTITASEIAANTITAAQIAADTITANELAANSVTANELAANSVVAGDLQAGAVTAGTIAANAVTATEIAADSITTSELAANAVIAENITAGEVTSGKLVLTISGKNFGANDGSAGAPGIFFDSESNTGIVRLSGSVSLIHGGSDSFNWGPTLNRSFVPLVPNADNAVALGSTTRRWTEVWAVDGTINTSDERLKQDIEDSALGLDFVRSLRPRSYRWRDTPDTQAIESAELDEEALAAECRPHERRIRNVRAKQLAGKLTDADAEAIVEQEREALTAIRERHIGPVREAQARRRPGKRIHHGFVAQEVKAALDEAGMDAALWKQTPEGEQALAYTELIAPLVKAVQELAEENAGLAARVAALERA